MWVTAVVDHLNYLLLMPGTFSIYWSKEKLGYIEITYIIGFVFQDQKMIFYHKKTIQTITPSTVTLHRSEKQLTCCSCSLSSGLRAVSKKSSLSL